MTKSHDQTGLVIIVDDDPMLLESSASLLRSVGLPTLCFGSGQAVLEARLPDVPSCLVIDIRMPQMGGFEIQAKLAERGDDIPAIFVTGHGDIPMSVKAMKAGAVDFLPKPCRDQDLLDAIAAALERDRARRSARKDLAASQSLYDRLTAREKEVMGGVCRGLLNKQVGAELGITEITVKLHRSSLMKKLGAKSFAELIRMNDFMRSQGI
ncbi:response regulator transcription factor [Novosphingobium terrae]|uniref:response regulator transcription factor n=1 Tax=Novosphingobium terrae TaxID=2726189 RepID=UPI001981AB77|nr:response regulator [Novosphingobium terrae]